MANNPDTGAPDSQVGNAPPGKPQNPYSHSDSGNSGNSTTTNNGPGTAGAVPETKGPGGIDPSK